MHRTASQQKITWPQISIVLWLRNPGLEAFWGSHPRSTYRQVHFEHSSLWVRANLTTWRRTPLWAPTLTGLAILGVCRRLLHSLPVCEDSGSYADTESDGTEEVFLLPFVLEKANVRSRVPNTTSLLYSRKLRNLNTNRIPHPQLRAYRSSPH